MKTVGISDIAVYLPKNTISLNDIITGRARHNPELKRQFQRAVMLIEQQCMRFPARWEDPVTMAAESSLALLTQNPRIRGIIRYIVSATESAIDMAKPIAAYVLGCLQKAGISLSNALLTYQVQHACAGGSLGLFGLATMVQRLSCENAALLSCTDIARYEEKTTAELTQGAGSVSLLVEQEPKLLSLDLERVGMYAADVDDFFRPTWSVTAAVRGRFSIECYKQALSGAFEDYASQCGKTPTAILAETDYVIVHVPFVKMAFLAIQHLYTRYSDYTTKEIQGILSEKDFFESLAGIQSAGNMYTASIFFVLRDQLLCAYRRYGEGIIGKSVLMCSYGSGNTMVCMQGTITADAAATIKRWNDADTDSALNAASFSDYEAWLDHSRSEGKYAFDAEGIAEGFFLKSIREDGYRVYSYAKTNPQTQE